MPWIITEMISSVTTTETTTIQVPTTVQKDTVVAGRTTIFILVLTVIAGPVRVTAITGPKEVDVAFVLILTWTETTTVQPVAQIYIGLVFLATTATLYIHWNENKVSLISVIMNKYLLTWRKNLK